MSAVAARRKIHRNLGLSAEAPKLLKQLAERHGLGSLSYALEYYLAVAEAVVLKKRRMSPGAMRLGARLRELAAQQPHPGQEVFTSYALDPDFTEVLRGLQSELQLSRRDLVVEYVVRAAWDERNPDDGSEDDDAPTRRLRAASHMIDYPKLAVARTDGDLLAGQLALTLAGRLPPES